MENQIIKKIKYKIYYFPIREREGGRERESLLIFSCQRRERERERVFVIILKFDLIIY